MANNTLSLFSRARECAGIVAFACFAALSAAASVTLTTTPGATLPVSDAATVEATVTGDAESVTLWFFDASMTPGLATNGNTVAMSSLDGTTYTTPFPFLPAGTFKWYVEARFFDGTSERSATQSITIDPNMTYDRAHEGKYHNVYTENAMFTKKYGWVQGTPTSTSTEFTATTPGGGTWVAHGCGWAQALTGDKHKPVLSQYDKYYLEDNTVGITFPVIYFYNLDPAEKPYIRTPKLEGGVGSFTFCAKAIVDDNSKVKVQISRSPSDDPPESSWEDVQEYALGKRETAWAFTNVLNDASVTYVRILRTERNLISTNPKVGFVAIDNISVSRPSPDVTLGEYQFNPGYPAVNEPVKVRCKVTTNDRTTPAYGRKLNVFYKWNKDASAAISGWASTNMTLLRVDGETEIYEAELPAAASTLAGFMHYYFQCDFDGYKVTPAQVIGTEYYNAYETTRVKPSGKDHLTYNVRSFKSRYGTLEVMTYENGRTVSYPMDLSGDNEWQVTVPVSSGVPVTAHFVGREGYEADAADYTHTPNYYGDNYQTRFLTPTGGRPACEPGKAGGGAPDDLTKVRVEPSVSGYLLYRLNDSLDASELDYVVKQGVYQTFDNWDADPDHYADSWGLAGTQTLTEDFDDWSADLRGLMETNCEDFARDTADFTDATQHTRDDTYSASDVLTANGWFRNRARIIPERLAGTNVLIAPHQAVVYNGGRLGNTGTAMTPGLESVTFRARASVADRRFALYSGAALADWKPSSSSAITISPTFNVQVEDRAASQYYFSLIFCYYQPLGCVTPAYYEARFVQSDSTAYSGTTPSDNGTRVEVWRHNLDAPEDEFVPVGLWVSNARQPYNYANGNARAFKDAQSVNVRIKTATYNINGNRDTVEIYITGNFGNFTFVDPKDEGALVDGGTFGFGCFDCLPRVQKVNVTGAVTFSDYSSKFPATKPTDWTYGGVNAVGGGKLERWGIDTSSGGNPVLKRRVQAQIVTVYSAPRADGATRAFDGELQLKDSKTVNSLKFGTFTVPVKAWNESFAELRVNAGDGAVAFGDVTINSWRGTTRMGAETDVPYQEWTTKEDQAQWYDDGGHNSWIVMEGWVTNSAAGNLAAELERSRANPALDQCVIGPRFDNGLGVVSFDYKTSGGKAIYAIERSSEIDPRIWETEAVYTNTANQTGSRYCNVATNYPTQTPVRARIRLLPESDPGAKLVLDNLLTRDYPQPDSRSWRGYNICVSSNLVAGAVFSGKSCVLNDNYHDGLNPGAEDLADDTPYVQSPYMPAGIGEIAFVYRPLDNAHTGTVSIALSATGGEDPGEWEYVVTNLLLGATSYVKFCDPKIYEKGYHYMRIYSSVNDEEPFKHLPSKSRRACIDNILVTEPMKADYMISRVVLLPAQPVVGTNVTVEASISNELLNPKDKVLYVSWHVGEESWGYTNWWSWSSPRLQLFKVGNADSRTYRTQEGEGIPATEAGAVVQYVVWGIHADISVGSPDVIFENYNCFTNPAWYGSVNKNEEHVEEGFSPYFLIYSCPPGAVWINEVWHYGAGTEHNHEFIEICGPAGTDIGGWEVNSYNYSNADSPRTRNIIPEGTKLPSDYNGWGFYVVGDTETPNVDLVAKYSNKDCVPTKQDVFASQRGGVELARNGGIVEHRVSMASAASYVPKLTAAGFAFIGSRASKGKDNSLSLVDSPANDYSFRNFFDSTFYWNAAEKTPGAVNMGQTLKQQGEEPTTFWFTAVINSLKRHGTQNGKTETIRVEVDAGASTSVVYVADSWYKIEAVRSNGDNIAAAAGKRTYTMALDNIQADVSNEVWFAEMTASDTDSHGHKWSAALLDWFRSKGWSEDEIDAGDNDALTVEQEYLLNTSPILDTEVALGTTDIVVDGDGFVTLTLGLTRADDGKAVTDGLNGQVGVYGQATLDPDGTWTRIGAASLPAGAFDGKTSETTPSFDAATPGLRFFQWQVE